MPKFKREFRYIVTKLSDANEALNDKEKKALHFLYEKIDKWRAVNGKRDFKVVVVEDDWPEYEPTWRALEERWNKEHAGESNGQ